MMGTMPTVPTVLARSPNSIIAAIPTTGVTRSPNPAMPPCLAQRRRAVDDGAEKHLPAESDSRSTWPRRWITFATATQAAHEKPAANARNDPVSPSNGHGSSTRKRPPPEMELDLTRSR
jgi:hypothetical protein